MYINLTELTIDFDNISLNFICSVVTKLRHFTSAEIIDQEDKMQVTSSEFTIIKKSSDV